MFAPPRPVMLGLRERLRKSFQRRRLMAAPFRLAQRRPLLLTPGPLTTSSETKRAACVDLGSRDGDCIALIARLRRRLLALAGGGPYTTVLMQGSGMFALEAMIRSFVPASGKVLTLANGVYGRRLPALAETAERPFRALDAPECAPFPLELAEAALRQDGAITHMALVHCETSSGVKNDIEAAAALARRYKVGLLVDAMSSFGALKVNAQALGLTAVAASANKCLEGLPGLGFVIARADALSACKGRARSLTLDLEEQWRVFERSGQFRFTPPVQVLAALDSALDQLEREGGTKARLARYSENCRILVDGLKELGFTPYLADPTHQAPVIVRFTPPETSPFSFDSFYAALKRRGFVIYATPDDATAFRVGCIGDVYPDDMSQFTAAVGAVMSEGRAKNGHGGHSGHGGDGAWTRLTAYRRARARRRRQLA